ncbi:MAG: ParB/RepB/Spo0J family partition protein [Inquilinus sp.]|uniref:ParB/RepB/Spo0J family partition protein n=1 Tax=Inquilinus sp. TaxID=1932117 RepID=UPI003F3CE73B
MTASETRRIPLWRISASPLNPRKTFDPAGLQALAAAIRTDGLLQALVARPVPDKLGLYELIAGERRLRAMKLLCDDGTEGWTTETEVDVQVREDVDDLALLRMATAENVQRQDMHPLDEGEAYAALCDRGETPEAIATMIGLTVRHVQERIRIARDLAPVAAVAFRGGEVSLAQARALSRGTIEQQGTVLDLIVNGPEWRRDMTADDVREALTEECVPVDRALFKRDLYKGRIIEPEDGDKGPALFEDHAQFELLQRQEIERRRVALTERFGWCEVIEQQYGPHFYGCGYVTVPGGEREAAKAAGHLGAVILVSKSSLQVEIQESVRKEVKIGTAGSRSDKVVASDRPKDPIEDIGVGQLRAAKRLKTWALQDALLGLPTVAMRLACLSLIIGDDRNPPSLTHIRTEHYTVPEVRIVSPAVRAVLERFRLDLGEDHLSAIQDDDPYLRVDSYAAREAATARLWERLKVMSDAEVQDLFAAIVASRFRLPADPSYGMSLGDPSIGVDLADIAVVRMERRGVLQDEAYLGALKADQLLGLALRIGLPPMIDRAPKDGELIAGKVILAKAKAGELRAAILKHALENDVRHVPPEIQFGGQLWMEESIRAVAKIGALPPSPPASDDQPTEEEIRQLGVTAYQAGKPITDCQFGDVTWQAMAWKQGWEEAQADEWNAAAPEASDPAAAPDEAVRATVRQRGVAAFEAGRPIEDNDFIDGTWQFATWRDGWEGAQASVGPALAPAPKAKAVPKAKPAAKANAAAKAKPAPAKQPSAKGSARAAARQPGAGAGGPG